MLRLIHFNDRLEQTKQVLNRSKTQFCKIIPEGRTGDISSLHKGEVLKVAQAYREIPLQNSLHSYLAGWKDKRYVEATYMPHQIKIIAVRFINLQDISAEDIIREGIILNADRTFQTIGFPARSTAQEAFRDMISVTVTPNIWERNPRAVLYDFTLEC